MYLWRGVAAEALEPYFQLASGAVIVLIAAWMFWRTWREQHGGAHGHSHDGDHEHLGHMHGPEPHATGHRHDSAFVEPGGRRHDAIHEALHGLEGAGDQDAHQLAHANAIRRRFTNRNVSNWQIAFFGLTGGLIPCPAAVTVLLLCLQLKEITLGAVLVLCFSIGLAITLVTVGAVAALGARQVSRSVPGSAQRHCGRPTFKPADHRGWHLRGYSWLAWADPTLSMSPDRAQWQVNEFRARGNTPIPIIREHHDT